MDEETLCDRPPRQANAPDLPGPHDVRNSSVAGSIAAQDELASLLRAVASGCQRSFARLYTLTNRRLMLLARSVCSDQHEAEEALQEAYIKIWERAAQFDGQRGTGIQWLYGLVRNSAVDCHRRRRRRIPVLTFEVSDEDPGANTPAPGPDASELLFRKRLIECVVSALEALSPHLREAVVLAFCEDLTHREIAHKLGCPLGTVKARVRRGLRAMRPDAALRQLQP